MSTGLAPFTNGEFELQLEQMPDGGFRVFAPGLARALSIDSAYNLLRAVPEEEKGSSLVSTPGGEQRVGFVTEAGFYRALATRQLGRIVDDDVRASVERFQAWVYREVLPALRRGQEPGQRPAELSRRELAQLVIDEADRADQEAAARQVAESKVAELEPAAQSWNRLATARGDDYSVAEAAQIPMSHYHPRTGELILDPPQIRVTVKGLEWLHRQLGGTAAVAVPARQESLL